MTTRQISTRTSSWHRHALLSALLVCICGCAANTGTKTTSSNRNASSAAASVNSASASNQAAVSAAVGADALSPALSAGQKREQEKLLHRKLIGQMMEQGSWYAALAHCDAYDQQWGADIHSRLLRADAQRMTGQLQAAEKQYVLLRDTSLKAQALHGLSQIAAQRGQWAQALALLSEAIRVQPLNPRLYNDQGLVLTLLNKPQEAFVALRKSQELEPDRALARANIALYAAVYDEDALFNTMSTQLNWRNGDIETVKAQALRIRAAHQQGKTPNPDIFSGR
jgi:Flp pilus assembly protein TadD